MTVEGRTARPVAGKEQRPACRLRRNGASDDARVAAPGIAPARALCAGAAIPNAENVDACSSNNLPDLDAGSLVEQKRATPPTPYADAPRSRPDGDPTLTRLIGDVISELRQLRLVFENRIAQDEGRPLNEQDAAAFCRMSVETLRYYGKRLNEIPYIKVGRERLYLRDDLDQFLRARRVGRVRKVR